MLVFYSVLISTLVRLVRPCSMHVGILFDVSTLSTAMFFCILVFYSVLVRLVRLVRPCSMYAGILFGLSTLVRFVRPIFIFTGMHAWLSSVLPQSRACKNDS